MNNERIYPAAPVITSGQRAKLRSMASTMSPVTQIGKGGVTENFLTGIDDALEARELIKISVLETSEYTPREAAEGIADDAFLRMKRSALGRRIRQLDSFDGTCFRTCAYHFSGFDYFRFPEIYRSIEKDEIRNFIARIVTEERSCLSLIRPIT